MKIKKLLTAFPTLLAPYRDVLALGGLLLLGVFIALPVFSDGILLGWDAPGHLLKTQFFIQELLPTGQWNGWFSYWHSGFELFELYPPGFYVFSAVLHGFLGFLGISTSFKLASVLAYALLAPACYWLLRSFGLNRLGALSGGIFSLLVGGRPGAGIVGTFDVGLIPNAMGLTLLVGFLAAFDHAHRTGTRTSQAVAALVFGALMLTHAFSAYVAVMLSVLYVCLRLYRGEMRWEALIPSGGIIAAGLIISAFWWVPALFAIHEHGYILGWLTPSLEGALGSLFSGELVGNLVVSFLGVAGFALAVWRHKTEDIFLVLGATILFWLSLGQWSFLPLVDVAMSSQSVRFLGPFVVVWALLAALAVGFFCSVGLNWVKNRQTRLFQGLLGVCLVGVILLAVFPVFDVAKEHIRTESMHPAVSDVKAAMDWISLNTPISARFVSEYHEVVQGVYGTPYGTPHILNQFLALYAKRSDVSGNFPEGSPSSFGSVLFPSYLAERPEWIKGELIQYGVSYAISYAPPTTERLRAASGYSPVFQRGAIAVFRLDGAPTHPFRGPLGTFVESFQWSPDGLDANMATVQTVPVDVAVTFHKNWRAFIDGVPVTLTKSSKGLIQFSLPAGTHTVRLKFEMPLYVPVLLFLGFILTILLVFIAWGKRV